MTVANSGADNWKIMQEYEVKNILDTLPTPLLKFLILLQLNSFLVKFTQ